MTAHTQQASPLKRLPGASLACFLSFAAAVPANGALPAADLPPAPYAGDITKISIQTVESGCTKGGRNAAVTLRLSLIFAPENSFPVQESTRMMREIKRTLRYVWRDIAGDLTLDDFVQPGKTLPQTTREIGLKYVAAVVPLIKSIPGTEKAQKGGSSLNVDEIWIYKEPEERCNRRFAAGPALETYR